MLTLIAILLYLVLSVLTLGAAQNETQGQAAWMIVALVGMLGGGAVLFLNCF